MRIDEIPIVFLSGWRRCAMNKNIEGVGRTWDWNPLQLNPIS